MSDNIDDNEDFDIYADLEGINDNNVDRNNDSIDCDESQIQNNTKVFQTLSTNTQINNDNNNINNVNINNNREDNDLILSELSILEKILANTENQNKDLLKLNQQLKEELEKKDKQLFVLKTNISSLYKTAKAEIERKKREISELRESYDSIVFKRLNNRNDKINSDNYIESRVNDPKVAKTFDSGVKKFCNKSTNTSSDDHIRPGFSPNHYKVFIH